MAISAARKAARLGWVNELVCYEPGPLIAAAPKRIRTDGCLSLFKKGVSLSCPTLQVSFATRVQKLLPLE